MAIGNPALCANAGETTSDNQTVITTTASIPDGQYIVGVVVSDGNAVDGNTNIHTALDVGGVALTKVREQQEGGASAAASVVVSLWIGKNDTGSQINSGSNVTADFDAARADKRITIISGTIGSGNVLELADGTSLDFDNYVSSGGNDMRAQSTSGMTSESHLHVAAWGCDATATTFTASTNFTRVSTTGQVTGTNGTRIEWRINTSTGETSDPSSNCGNSTEWAVVFAAFREVAGGAAAFELDLAPGSYVVTGAQAQLLEAAILNLAPGSYAVTGVQAQLVRGRFLNLVPGAYALTGAQAQLLEAAMLNLAPGSYAITGAVAQLVRGLFLSLVPGAYTLTGFEADLVHEVATAFEIALDPGSYALTGAPAGLLAARTLNLAPGSYALSGAVQQLLAARVLSLAPGAYNLTGAEAQLVYSAAEVAVTRFRTLMGLGT